MEEGQNDEGRLQLMLNSERIARPSMDDMRARVYEAATEASYACTHPNCATPTPIPTPKPTPTPTPTSTPSPIP